MTTNKCDFNPKKLNTIAQAFKTGAGDLLPAALIVGMGLGIVIAGISVLGDRHVIVL
ncbi:MAG: hypothetical protein QG663_1253 [Thermodesulfobacteriota bacterium]|nr:hypothetical protein [Thermodesulfobacteriota bacterium]